MSHSRKETESEPNNIVAGFKRGCKSGVAETLINHPLWVVKTRLQNKELFTLNPKVLYRGVLVNASSMVPTTMLQMGMNQVFTQHWFGAGYKPTPTESFMAAFMAGGVSALVSCPTESVMTQMGMLKQRFWPTVNTMVKTGGYRSLFAGFAAAADRDGKFTASYIVGKPLVEKWLDPEKTESQSVRTKANLMTGLIATAISHPDDTIKTAKQSAPVDRPISYPDAARNIYNERGFLGFFKGAVPRGVRVASALMIFDQVKEYEKSKLKK